MRSIYLIGAGNLATQLGMGLVKEGIPVAGVYSRTMASAKLLGEKLHCPFTDDFGKIPTGADIYILSVKDDVLLQDLPLQLPEDKIIAHTSGSMEIDVLKKYGMAYGSFYPLYTFTKEKEVMWSDIPVCVEGNDAATMNVLKDLAEKLSGKVYELNGQQRAMLHLSAVWANNFTNYLLYAAETLCKTENIPFSILEPIALETIQKAFLQGPFSSQTGPALRGDRKTLEKHLRLLGEDEIKSSLYIMMSKAIRDAHSGMN